MGNRTQPAEDYQRIERAIRFIEAHFKSQPSLEQIAQSIHLSKFHFDRLFKRWAGISPIQFLQFMTLDYAKQRLSESRSLLDTAWDAGLSGPGRLHDLFVTFEAVTPGEFKKQAAGLHITYGFHPTPFGDCLLAATERGICHLSFVAGEDRSIALDPLRHAWPQATFAERPKHTGPLAKRLFDPAEKKAARPFHLYVRGTNFQISVWKALVSIPAGWLVSYQDVASHIGRPQAFRAVANAVAINPVAYLIPCHRVITGSGRFHKYRWGSARKKALIGWEAAQTGADQP